MTEMDVAAVTIMVLKSILVIGLLHTCISYRSAKLREAEQARTKSTANSTAPAPAAAMARAGAGSGKTQADGEDDDASGSAAKKLTILFASQTGTAEGFAATIAGEAKVQGFRANLQCIEDYTDGGPEQLADEELVVLLAATYGEGEPTDDAVKFKKWLDFEGHGADMLPQLNYLVFGLGDRTYEQFCAMGHFYHDRLAALGAKPLLPAGEGDDAADIMADFESWRQQMWSALRRHVYGENASSVTFTLQTDDGPLTYGFQAPSQNAFIGAVGGPPIGDNKPVPDSLNPLIDGKPWIHAQLKTKCELHSKPASPRSCLHLEFDISAAAKGAANGTAYAAGDHVGLFCENDPKLVAMLARRLRCKTSDAFRLRAADSNPGTKQYHIPSPTTVGTALTKYLDISRPPSQQLLLVLAEAADEAAHRQQLLWLASREGKEDYAEDIVSPQCTVLEVLYGFGSVEVGLDQIAEHLPRLQVRMMQLLLQPRLYSISSSPRCHPRSVHVTAAVVQYQKPVAPEWLIETRGKQSVSHRQYDGICTSWLARLDPNKSPTVQLYLRENAGFKLPPASKRTMLPTPSIMIGPGTGLAPFRGFIQDRAAAGDAGFDELFFGCRSVHEDYIYREELEAAAKPGGVLTHLHVAFSRDQQEKVYVQHLLRTERMRLWELIEKQSAAIYVCGDGQKMAADVNAALREMIACEGEKSPSEVEEYITMLKSAGRYQQDVW